MCKILLYCTMLNFINQFKKAKLINGYLLYDKRYKRYLITNKKAWCTWDEMTVIKKF